MAFGRLVGSFAHEATFDERGNVRLSIRRLATAAGRNRSTIGLNWSGSHLDAEIRLEWPNSVATQFDSRSTPALDARKVLPVKLVTFTNAGQLLDRCEGWLFERSDIHNTMYSSLLLVASQSPVFTGPYWFGAIEDGSGDIVACGTHNLPDGLYMAEIPGSTVDAVVESIIATVGVPHRIMAPRATAASLVERSSERTDMRGRFHDRWLTYRLDKAVADVEGVPGRLRKGRQDDDDLIAKWGRAYEEEEPGHIDVADFMLRKRSEGNLYIWDDNGPRSMLTLSGPAGTGIRISSVFTSHTFRRRGYASAAVATVSEAQLNNGREFVVLSVIDGHPAERIYQRLGFSLIGSRDCYVMDT